jgi:NAD(P)-dependent dehydrogenase (short-subunit alcohol dehydrogenase family)
MKPIDEQIILVTGSTDGIGKLAARDLAKRGATVILHGRDLKKGEAVLDEIREDTGNHRLSFHLADFSSLSEVRRLADEIEAGFPALDVLINNAGVGIGKPDEKKRMLSRDGYELRFAVNYLAPFFLTQLLLPSLRKASPSRIVNVSSAAQSAIDFDDLMIEDGYDPMEAYSRSKLALAMFTFELAERVQDEKITVNCLHPGSLLDTKMVRESFS